MNIEIINLHDKWKESTYNYNKLKPYCKDIKLCDIRTLNSKDYYLKVIRLKYEFNSFVNSIRSITFVLQKTFRSKGVKFENWYNEKLKLLESNELSTSLSRIRNINQKEGNFYPEIKCRYSINNDLIFSKTITTIPKNDITGGIDIYVTNFQIEMKSNSYMQDIKFNKESPSRSKFYGVNVERIDEKTHQVLSKKEIKIPKKMKFHKVEKILNEDLIKNYIIELNEKKQRITEEDVKNLAFIDNMIVLDRNITYSVDEFLKKSLELIHLLKDICMEAEKEFSNQGS